MVLQKLSSFDQGSKGFQSQRNGENVNPNSGFALLPISRTIKLKFPRFFGEDLASWVYKANQYFRYYNTPIREKLRLASFQMEGEALIWFQKGEETGVLHDWDSLIQALHVRFGTTAYDDPMETLTRLR